MAVDSISNGGAQQSHGNGNHAGEHNFTVKAGLAQMLKGGVIMDVVNAEQVRSRFASPIRHPCAHAQAFNCHGE